MSREHSNCVLVQASVAANTFVVNGKGQTKELLEALPDVMGQLGPEQMHLVQQVIAQMQAAQGGAAGKTAEGEEDDDDVPDLVDTETFDNEQD